MTLVKAAVILPFNTSGPLDVSVELTARVEVDMELGLNAPEMDRLLQDMLPAVVMPDPLIYACRYGVVVAFAE